MEPKLYPKSPEMVPANIATPNKSYKKHVWIASGALILFMLMYFGLSIWFLYKSITLFINVFKGGNDTFLSLIVAVLMGFLGVFMVKAIFFIIKRDKSKSLEIKPEDEPELFAFIYKVADEVKAPRPHKVFISEVVNAMVFYDISILNLFFPSKKSLEIGLGLVNTLNLGEFKSILAHEFGHFAQKSMVIGKWVYIAQQVAHQIVSKRDGFDSFLNGISRVDIRIAWIGWILSIIVWSLRAISETFFKLVIYTQRSLSREMEFHADLVAVSITGSDAIVHSLYKLTAADEAYEEALTFANKQLKKNKSIPDIFSIQSNCILHMAKVLNNPNYGMSPNLNGTDGSKFKVFKEQLAQAPKMWSTHPSNMEREKNAKKFYIPSIVDERSPWNLFKDPALLKNKVTQSLYKDVKQETTPLTPEESITAHNQEFQRKFLEPKYRGIYLNRLITLHFKKVEDIYNQPPPNILFTDLYPPTLQEQLEQLKNLEEEIEMLEGLNKKVLDPNEGKINYRGRELSRKDLPETIIEAKKEASAISDKLIAHDVMCRNAHYNAAYKLGNGWDKYLVSNTQLIHYCEHSQRNIEDLSKYFYESLNITAQIRSFGGDKLTPLLIAANSLHAGMAGVFNNVQKIELSPALKEKLEATPFDALLKKFEFAGANHDNINEWLNAVSSWIQLVVSGLYALKTAAIDELLTTEEFIEKANSGSVISAPQPHKIDFEYPLFDENNPRQVTQKLDILSRFYNADGMWPTLGRLGVAASIILFAIFFSFGIGNSRIYIYNGLPQEVIVHINNKTIHVGDHETQKLEVGNSNELQIKTTTSNGAVIEDFKANMPGSSSTYVYNVANAAVMYKWEATYAIYGTPNENDNTQILGAKRWFEISADYFFEEPPETISVESGKSETKEIVSALNAHPFDVVSIVDNLEERNLLISSNAKWGPQHSTHIFSWLALASNLPQFKDILQHRLSLDSLEVISLRAQQDLYIGAEKEKICNQQNQMYIKNPDNADMYYLKCRCMGDGPEQDAAFFDGFKKWPTNAWLANASAYAYTMREDWENALNAYSIAYNEANELKEIIAIDKKRIQRFLNKDTEPTDLEMQIPLIRYLYTVDNSAENSTADKLYAFKLLASGKVKEALHFCESDTNTYPLLLRLAAVSDGAEKETIDKALALPLSQGLDESTLIPTLALSIKNNLSIDIYKDNIEQSFGPGSGEFLKCIDAIKKHQIAEADELMHGLGTELKAKTCLLGVLLLGKQAPDKWHTYATGLLFIYEKPYLAGVL